MAVRSTMLIPPTVLGLTLVTIGGVDAGRTWIIREIVVTNGHNTTPCSFDVFTMQSGADRALLYREPVPAARTVRLPVWWALPELYPIKVSATNTSCTFHMHGANLLGVADAP